VAAMNRLKKTDSMLYPTSHITIKKLVI